MSKTAIFLIGFAIFAVVMLAFAIYEMGSTRKCVGN